MTGTILIRPVGEDEREAWDPLWAGYLAFYKTDAGAETPAISPGCGFTIRMSRCLRWAAISTAIWRGSPTICFIARPGRRTATAIWKICSLRKSARGQGLGRALIEAVYDKARAASASRVYWLTQSDNTQARALYDAVADNLGFIQYRKVL